MPKKVPSQPMPSSKLVDSAVRTNMLFRKKQWTDTQDKQLLKAIRLHGPKKWAFIATFLKNRIGKQCRERWHNHLNPAVSKEMWSPEEEWLLFLMHRLQGGRWSKMTRVLSNRTDNSIKNHWNSIMQKKLPSLEQRLAALVTANSPDQEIRQTKKTRMSQNKKQSEIPVPSSPMDVEYEDKQADLQEYQEKRTDKASFKFKEEYFLNKIKEAISSGAQKNKGPLLGVHASISRSGSQLGSNESGFDDFQDSYFPESKNLHNEKGQVIEQNQKNQLKPRSQEKSAKRCQVRADTDPLWECNQFPVALSFDSTEKENRSEHSDNSKSSIVLLRDLHQTTEEDVVLKQKASNVVGSLPIVPYQLQGKNTINDFSFQNVLDKLEESQPCLLKKRSYNYSSFTPCGIQPAKSVLSSVCQEAPSLRRKRSSDDNIFGSLKKDGNKCSFMEKEHLCDSPSDKAIYEEILPSDSEDYDDGFLPQLRRLPTLGKKTSRRSHSMVSPGRFIDKDNNASVTEFA